MATVKKTVKKAQRGERVYPTHLDNDPEQPLVRRRDTKTGSTSKYKDVSGDYTYKAKADMTGDVTSGKPKRTLKGMLSGAPTIKKLNASYGSSHFEKGGKVTKAKAGKQMIKRADGSYSQRGLWDNIRANKGSGKKPTAQMLKQEKKIKAASKKK